MRLGSRREKGREREEEKRRKKKTEKEKCPPDSVNFDPRASSILDSDVSHPVVDPYSSSEISSSSSSFSFSSSSSSSSSLLRLFFILGLYESSFLPFPFYFPLFSLSLSLSLSLSPRIPPRVGAESALTHCQKERVLSQWLACVHEEDGGEEGTIIIEGVRGVGACSSIHSFSFFFPFSLFSHPPRRFPLLILFYFFIFLSVFLRLSLSLISFSLSLFFSTSLFTRLVSKDSCEGENNG